VGLVAVRQSRSFRTRITTYFKNAKPAVFVADSSRADIERELRKAIEVEGEKEMRLRLREFGAGVKEFAEIISPFDGDDGNAEHYNSSWKLTGKNGARGKLPSLTLKNTDKLKNIIEGGTDSISRPQGGDSPAFHIFERVAARHGGTVDGIGGAEDEI
jgi:hypothetical protein